MRAVKYVSQHAESAPQVRRMEERRRFLQKSMDQQASRHASSVSNATRPRPNDLCALHQFRGELVS